jgi:NAD(P)-dependent dehydrogenase (short-subunit alcohol dehydrogenase family)
MVRFAVDQFGRLDCVFNNAGVGGAFGPITDTRVGDWDRTLAIVLGGTFLCIKHAAMAMIQQARGGVIVNNASVVAHVGDSAGAAYSAAKAGILSLTRSAAMELAEYRIRVVSLSPGTILTPLLHRGGDTEGLIRAAVEHQPWPEAEFGQHVAAAAAFAASHEVQFFTGEEMFVDGGACAAGPGYSSSAGSLREQLSSIVAAGGGASVVQEC